MPAIKGLLAVFAHPDDESLAAGGLLASHAASGRRVAVVTTTWAKDSPRAKELAEALRILGADRPRTLGYADARVPESAAVLPRLLDAPLDDVVRRLVGHIREFQPDVVVTHDFYGGLTGHPDHVVTHRATVVAVDAAGREELHPGAGPPHRPTALWLATHPASALPALRRIIGERKAVHTVPDEAVADALDVREWLDQKTSAILAHRSQVERGALPGLIASLAPELRETLLGTEWYIRRSVSVGRGPAS